MTITGVQQTERSGVSHGSIPTATPFKTKLQLAIDILADQVADHTAPPWCAADEVYGRSGELRSYLETQGIGYVLRVGCAFQAELAPESGPAPTPSWARTCGQGKRRWQTCSVAGSKGDRAYAWAWIATTSPQHYLLIREHLDSGELAYHYCYIPPGRPVTLMTLVRVACLRWPVEEDFEFGKDYFGLDHSQVRRYTALARHIVLTMAALAVCAVTAAQATPRAPTLPLPVDPDEPPPEHPGLIPLTVAEIKRLFALLTRRIHSEAHHLRWLWWRRRHQARAKWFHHRARLRHQTPAP